VDNGHRASSGGNGRHIVTMIDAIVIQQLQLPAYDDEIVTDRCTSDFT